MEAYSRPRAEGVLRLLASAVSTLRLYPSSSPLRDCAVEAFTTRANAVASAFGPLDFTVDPHGFRLGEHTLSRPFSQTTQLAESLHALQVGQLIVAPGITRCETVAFLEAILTDPALVRREGGIRARLLRAGTEHMAVIEVSLRASRTGVLCGADLAMLPLDELAGAIATAAQDWATSAGLGEGRDRILDALSDLEPATREVALRRTVRALLHLDEPKRMKVLAWALKSDASGKRMDGMLRAFATMSPSTLSHLLTVVASQAGTSPARIASAIDLSTVAACEVALLLAPSPVAESDCGVPPDVDHRAILEALLVEGDDTEIVRLVASSDPTRAAGRALTASVVVSRRHRDPETVEAIATALPRAARAGAFASTRIALRRLNELACDPALVASVSDAKATLAEPEVLTEMCRAIATETDATVAGEILAMSGALGGEILVDSFDRADDEHRPLMRPILKRMPDLVLRVANARLRGCDAFAIVRVIRTLPALEDTHAVSTLVDALHDVHTEVRLAAVRALADTPFAESRQALGKVLNHWDIETRRYAVREIGRVSAFEAIPSLLRSLGDVNVFRLNYELKKEIVRSLAQIGSADALPALKRVARRPALRRRTRELRLLAERAVLTITQSDPDGADGIRSQDAPPAQTLEASPESRTNDVAEGMRPAGGRPIESKRLDEVQPGQPQPLHTATGGVDQRG